MSKQERLMKFTGDIKALPYRELKEFATTLFKMIASNDPKNLTPEIVVDCIVATAEQINPDQVDTPDDTRRKTLAGRLA